MFAIFRLLVDHDSIFFVKWSFLAKECFQVNLLVFVCLDCFWLADFVGQLSLQNKEETIILFLRFERPSFGQLYHSRFT